MSQRSVNKVTLVGNVGADPAFDVSGSGTSVANFRMATSESWTGKDKERLEETQWHRVVVFGRLAEIVRDYVRKGAQLYIEGRLQYRQWETKWVTEIVANDVLLLGKKVSESASGAGGASAVESASGQAGG